MVYNSNLIAVVVCQNQITREVKENGENIVRIPFGSDYFIRLKNMNSTRAVINVQIDGKDVLSDRRLVVEPNTTIDLLGFMENNVVKSAFRFIQKTQEIVNVKGDHIDDGFIRITWRFEKAPEIVVKKIEEIIYREKYPYRPYPWYPPYDPYYPWYPKPYWTDENDVYYSSGSAAQNTYGFKPEDILRGSGSVSMSSSLAPQPIPQDFGQEGITVKGEDVNQNFIDVHINKLEEVEHVTIIHLLGKEKESGKAIKEPLLAHKVLKCPTCGRSNKSNNRFCNTCGTRIIG